MDTFALAYNAHEKAELAAMDALLASLRGQSVEALASLADPRWKDRGWMSDAIVDYASDVLEEKLEAWVNG